MKIRPKHISLWLFVLLASCLCGIIAFHVLCSQPSRPDDRDHICANNLHRIQAAKEEWAAASGAEKTAEPVVQDLLTFVGGKTNVFVCPRGGVYDLGAVGELPVCSYQESCPYALHRLPYDGIGVDTNNLPAGSRVIIPDPRPLNAPPSQAEK